MHQIFEEIGQHLIIAHYKGTNTVYRKTIDLIELIVEFEKCGSGNGFRVLIGSHMQTAPEKDKGKRNKVHVRDCLDFKTITDNTGTEAWPYHQDVEERVSMIKRILHEISIFENSLSA